MICSMNKGDEPILAEKEIKYWGNQSFDRSKTEQLQEKLQS